MELGDPIALVRRGYDAIGERYSSWADQVHPPLRLPYLERALAGAPAPVRAVELGCGPGIPVGRHLAERCAYLGVDLSVEMLRQAARDVPAGMFVRADMSRLELAPSSVNLVVAIYSIIHVPRDRHETLVGSIGRWLRPGGRFVAALGARDNPGDTEADWLGAGPMFWSGFDVDTNLDLLARAGFEVEDASVIDQVEVDNPVRFLWVTARRPGVRRPAV
jgi:SAM-dependent methyltransferase